MHLKLLCKAACILFKEDKTKPSVTISLIAEDEWYASVVRYLKPFGKEKQVVAKGRGPTLEDAINSAILDFIVLYPQTKEYFDATNGSVAGKGVGGNSEHARAEDRVLNAIPSL